MLALAVDTSGPQGSIALARGDEKTFELLATLPVRGGTFSAQLIPQISELLAAHQVNKVQIDGLVAASGPGSFTGLRVGLAAVKGLAEILQKPIAAVSVLQAIAAEAQAAGHAGRVLVAQDAGRGQLYVGEYQNTSAIPACFREEISSLDELAVWQKKSAAKLVTGDSISDWLKRMDAVVVSYPGSSGIARIGIKKILAGEVTTPEALDANYIRRADAELVSLPKILERTR